ncbi:MAG: hypothetical protein HQK81_13085 [Desulfovibrionaceae bacterium]|nr:hypothetical protein [Desulfovibrionaceae bacterium]MBF0514979.1 hypothetical protein [Desulfovibrionaceae bacterium]
MARIRDAEQARLKRRFFQQVAKRIMLAAACLAGVLALAMLRGYADLTAASLAEAMTGATGLLFLSL